MVALVPQFGVWMTKHATMRCQQRGVQRDGLLAVLEFGTVYHAGDGSRAYFLGRRALAEISDRLGVDLSRWRNTAAIVSADQAVITVQHVPRPKRSWRGHR
jgi:hypothetical protein